MEWLRKRLNTRHKRAVFATVLIGAGSLVLGLLLPALLGEISFAEALAAALDKRVGAFFIALGLLMVLASRTVEFIFRAPAIENEMRATQIDKIADLASEDNASDTPLKRASLILGGLATSSAHLAHRLFDRAGVFLLYGVLTAFVGIGIFVALTWAIPIKPSSGPHAALDYLIDLAPRLSVLLFVEIVALFLLRQYRTAMDEFRYYEAIKRHREETHVLLTMLAGESPAEVAKLVSVYSSAGKLSKDETTDLLESRKLNPDDAALINALGSFAQAIRGK